MMIKVSIPMFCIEVCCLFNSFKANLIVTSWGGHTLVGLAIRMRTKQITMCVLS